MMENKTKMFICITILFILAIIDLFIPKNNFIITGLMLFSMGFGWYAGLNTKEQEK